MSNVSFDIKEEVEQINTGGHFWCEACLTARQVDDRSRDPRYCKSCYGVVRVHKKEKENDRDYWADSDMTFVHHGKSYRLTTSLQTVCVENNNQDGPPNAAQAARSEQNGVAKIPDKEIHRVDDTQAQKTPIFATLTKKPKKRSRGRPRKGKEETVCRQTKWRQQKRLEAQAVLPL